MAIYTIILVASEGEDEDVDSIVSWTQNWVRGLDGTIHEAVLIREGESFKLAEE